MKMFKKKEENKIVFDIEKKEEKVMEEKQTVSQMPKKKDKNKKKGKKKWIIISIIAVILVVSIAAKALGGGEVALPVTVTQALNGDLTQTIETSGFVSSEEKKVYFADVSAKIEQYHPAIGSVVNKGDVMVTYDITDLELLDKQARLESKASGLGSDATLTALNETQKKAAEAATNYEDAKKYVAHFSDCVGQINAQLAEASELQIQVSGYQASLKELQVQTEKDPENKKLAKKIKETTSDLNKAVKKLEKYDIPALKSALSTCSADLEAYKMQEKENEALKDADPSINAQKAQQSVLKEASKLTTEQTEKNLKLAKEGIAAEFSGIISTADAVKGQTVAQGTPLFTLDSIEKVKVTISVSKYDLEKLATGQKAVITINGHDYNGTVSAINRIAQANQQGTPMVNADIHIDNPDENIFLGVEAKVKIETANRTQVLLVPMECINSDTKGDFCYIVEDGKIVRKDVTTGISSDLYIEIESGLTKGDKVVTDLNAMLEEGMSVTPVEEDAGKAAGTETNDAGASEAGNTEEE